MTREASDRGSAVAPLDRLSRFLGELAEEGFFGKVVLSYQNGQVSGVKLEQSKKLQDL